MSRFRSILRWVYALLAAFLAVGLVRLLVVTTCVLPEGGWVVINRWSYGLRMPFPSVAGYCRVAENRVEKSDRVAFDNPLEQGALEFRQVYIGRCAAGPGDSFRLNGEWFRIPLKGSRVVVTDANKALLREVLHRHEKRQAVLGMDGKLYVDGTPVKWIRLMKNYYWMQNAAGDRAVDSRTFGLVPEELLIGKVVSQF